MSRFPHFASCLRNGRSLPGWRPLYHGISSGLLAATILAFGSGLAIAEPTSVRSVDGLVALQVTASHPLLLAGEKQTNYVRIGLTGGELPSTKQRPAVNVALAIDNSGSMSGKKIDQARQAAIAAVGRLRDDDIISIVLYNSTVSVLVPATKASDRQAIIQQIETIQVQGSTALFAGVSKAAAEVRKFLSEQSVNRVILLSDGQANVGPSSPTELQSLGASLAKSGISVSTLGLGLGYNEDLMSGLALSGNGNHMFVEEADDLVAVFNTEFNDLLSVVAGDFEIEATLAEGVRPVKVLGTPAEIVGQRVFIPMTQLYSSQERYFVLEVEIEAGKAGTNRSLAEVTVNYVNKVKQASEKLTKALAISFSDQQSEVDNARDLETLAYSSVQIANERNRQATALLDAGNRAGAEELLRQNSADLDGVMQLYWAQGIETLPAIELNIRLNGMQIDSISNGADWQATGRKSMREAQNYNQVQQRSLPSSLRSGGYPSSSESAPATK